MDRGMRDTDPRADHWLILGSSPSMPKYVDAVMDKLGRTGWERGVTDYILATTNAGIYECLHQGIRPHYYGIIEVATPPLFGRYYRNLVGGVATRLVTCDLALRNDIETLEPLLKGEQGRVLQIADPDRAVRKPYYSDQSDWVPGEYRACGSTGGLLVQLALNMGAKHVHCLGMEGYRSAPGNLVVDTFDGRKGNAAGDDMTKRIYGPVMQQCFKACPEVQFHMYGKPVYSTEGKNVHVYPCSPAYTGSQEPLRGWMCPCGHESSGVVCTSCWSGYENAIGTWAAETG